MTKFNTIQFTAAASIDLTGEFEDLDEMIARGAEAAEEIRRQYSHLNSLIQGMEYTVEFIADEEARAELIEFLADMRKELHSRWAAAMAIIWGAKLNARVSITTIHHADGTVTYALSIDGRPIETDGTDKGVREYLHRQ